MINASSAGIAVTIAQQLSLLPRALLGAAAYPLAALLSADTLTASQVRLALDARSLDLHVLGVIVANGHSVGGGWQLAAEAELDDGWLDVAIVPVDLLDRLAQAVMTGDIVSWRDALIVQRARRVALLADPPLALNIDGEPLARTPARFEVLHRAATLIVPA
jgi:diacylglycerol kinase family enzyme